VILEVVPAGVVACVLLVGFVLWRAFERTGVSPMILISIAGLVVGAVAPQSAQPLLGPVFLAVFLPALVFEAAWDADARALRRAAVAIGVLAGPGVLVTAAIVAFAGVLSGSLTWPAALVLGALLSATDPVSVLAVFRRLALPTMLLTIVEGESVANDAVALALVQALLPLAIVGAAHPSAPVALVALLEVAGGGVLAGIIVALPAGLVMRSNLRGAALIVLTIAVAYAAYGAAAALGLSGIFASAAAGITLRSMARLPPQSPAAREIDRVWDGIAFASNAVVFALVGLTLRVDRLLHEPLLLLLVVAAVVLARLVLAYALVPLRGLTTAVRAWQHAIALAGLRGGLSLVLAIGLPATMPGRIEIRDATFAVVFVTLILQGPLIAPLLGRLVVSEP